MRRPLQLLEPFRSQDCGTPSPLVPDHQRETGGDCWKLSVYERAPDRKFGDQPLCARGDNLRC